MHKSFSTDKKVFTTFHITTIGIYSALIFALQIALAFIPNVELVTFLLSFSAIVFTIPMAIIITGIFITLEGIFYGFADWIITYIVIWYALVFICIILKKILRKQWFLFVLINSITGFVFGSIDSLIKIPLYGMNFFYGYWIKGLIFDLIHGVSNFVVAFFLIKPCLLLWERNLVRYFK